MKRIPRVEYMEWLNRWRDKDVIKIISGIRRCGKSTLLSMLQENLLAEGVAADRIISINFEDVANEHLTNYHKLHAYIADRLSSDTMTYVFLDEVQHVEQFEKVLDSLYIKPHCDLYVTGSNAYMLSGELATLLTGRFVELKMLPLSFKEFCLGAYDLSVDAASWGLFARSASRRDDAFTEFLHIGAFPYVLDLLDDYKNAKEYLHDVYQSILYKDIVARMKVSDAALLERVGKTLASEVGSLVSVNKITNTLRSTGRTVDQKTVDKYISGFVESMLFYEAPRWDVRGRRLLSRISKYYIVDTGLRRNLVEGSSSDIGHLFENVVYLELMRRGGNVYVGSVDDGEIDFVVVRDDEICYYQVAVSVLDSQVLDRELAAFKKAKDNYPRVLLTLDRILPTTNIDGVKVCNAVDWLLGID